MKKKLVTLLTTAVLGVSMLAGCTDATSAGSTTGGNEGGETSQIADQPSVGGKLSGTLNLGMIGPLTGGAAIYGNAVKNGEQIAVDEINAISPDFQIQYNPQDDEHDPEKSVNAYNNLKDWNV